MKETFEVKLADGMIKRIANEVIRELKDIHSDVYEITNEEVYKTIDEILIINHNWYATPEETEKIFKEVVFKL